MKKFDLYCADFVYEEDHMCRYCDYENSDDNEIFIDSLTNEYYLDVQTGEWDSYDDDYVHQKIYITYCPFCGRKLITKGIVDQL